MTEEQNNTTGTETESFVDAVLGDRKDGASAPDTGHSPAPETEPAASAPENDGDQPIPDDTDAGIRSDDSIEEHKPPREEPPSVDQAALKQEIEGLKKRLHDTQAAMHKATGERAALQKELDALKAKKDNEDDWFSEEESGRVAELEHRIQKSDAEIARVQEEERDLGQKQAVAQWDADAAPVIKAHPDFEKVVYDDLVPLLDPKTGNATVREQWEALQDKSPAATYAFAKKMLDILDFQRDPQAYRERLRKEIQNNSHGTDAFDDAPVGKAGLDMLPSADMDDAGRQDGGSVSFVDAVFGRNN